MPKERLLKTKEAMTYLECYCHTPGFAAARRIISKEPWREETRYGGSGCTCTKISRYKRSRPFRVGGAVIVGGWKK